MRFLRICISALAGLSLTGIALYAQNITGSIVGQVADASGSAIPGTAITVRNTSTGAVSQAATDVSGSYSIPNLLAGAYEITAQKEGFQTLTIGGIQLLSAQTLRQDVKLQVGAVQQKIEVAGQALLIRTDTQTIGSSLGSRQVADLPLFGRSIDSLIALAPGVVTSGAKSSVPLAHDAILKKLPTDGFDRNGFQATYQHRSSLSKTISFWKM